MSTTTKPATTTTPPPAVLRLARRLAARADGRSFDDSAPLAVHDGATLMERALCEIIHADMEPGGSGAFSAALARWAEVLGHPNVGEINILARGVMGELVRRHDLGQYDDDGTGHAEDGFVVFEAGGSMDYRFVG